MAPALSIVIPTLDAGDRLRATLGTLDEASASGLAVEVIVADGGSTDGTEAIARQADARFVVSRSGRGEQLAVGAGAATGAWLLFLHADTALARGWSATASAFMSESTNARRAAAFRFALDDPHPAARRVESLVAWRSRALGLPYGDQGLLISRAFYDELGGYRTLPLMEDVDLIRRVGRRRLTMLNLTATTSAARYRRGGYVWRPLRNLTCLSLYLLGLPPRWILRLYG